MFTNPFLVRQRNTTFLGKISAPLTRHIPYTTEAQRYRYHHTYNTPQPKIKATVGMSRRASLDPTRPVSPASCGSDCPAETTASASASARPTCSPEIASTVNVFPSNDATAFPVTIVWLATSLIDS